MSYTSDFPFGGNENAPKPLLYLIISIGVISIGSTLFDGLFAYFNLRGPEDWFGLSLYGMKNFFIWQPLTYLFTQNNYSLGISLSYLIHLSFNLYILWVLGGSIIERIGISSFFKLFFTSGIVAGIAALAVMKLIGSSMVLSGPGSALLGLLSFWTLVYSDAILSFFLFLQVKAKWLAAFVFGLVILSCLFSFDIVSLTLYLTGILVGYLFAVIGYDLKSPFPFLESFEKLIKRLFKGNDDSEGKIIDIKTGKALDDEIFVDEMLAKISKYGEDSLTFYERRRLDSISKRKK